MDTTTTLITMIVSVCVIAFSIAVFGGALYGILVWYPRKRQERVDDLKSKGKRGEATIIRLPDHKLGPPPGKSSVFTILTIGLEIRVLGIETYEVDKRFTFPTHGLGLLKVGKVVTVWVDPNAPRNLDKIVIDVE